MSAVVTYCSWTEDEEGVWGTDCGEAFEFNDGGPKENRARFCCYCGKKLREVKYALGFGARGLDIRPPSC